MTIRTIALTVLTLGVSACALWQEDEIPIAQLPPAAADAARGAVPGFELKSAEAKDRDGRTVYEIDGKANGVKHEVLVSANGEVIKVKAED